MIFSSVSFIFLFLPIVLCGTWLIHRYRPHSQWPIIWLLAASVFFYAVWKIVYLPILLGSVLVNWLIGEKLRGQQKKTWLYIGIIFNLGLLGYFKYADFFLENINELFGLGLPYLNILLPLGISFFTFQQIAYLVDTRQGKTEKTGFLNYGFFVSFFPQLIAGPIVHHRHILPYIKKPGMIRVSSASLLDGLFIFSIGFFKKVMIADSLAVYATPFFGMADQGTALETHTAIMGMLAYTLQIYFDFSGYSDMAIGLGLMFGIRLPLNFYSPYKAVNIIEFWRRWHMTLSEFLRDYLYIPLGGNRKGPARRHANLMITMLLGGLWHGASWNFVFWGGMHGLYLMINHGWQTLGISEKLRVKKWTAPLFILFTFGLTALLWVPFRAETWQGTMLFYQSFFNFPDSLGLWLKSPLRGINMIWGWGLIVGAFAVSMLMPNSWQLLERYEQSLNKHKLFYRFYAFGLFLSAAFGITYLANRTSEFIYFNF